MDSTPELPAELDKTFGAALAGHPYPIGILFVHGMGEQERGDTITQMGDALSEWLRKELANKPGTDFTVRAATLRGREAAPAATAPSDMSGRANVSLVLTGTRNGTKRTQEWLLAESWWADAFRPATFFELVAWAIAVGPWLIASQEAALLHRLRVARLNVARPLWRRLVDRVVGYLLVIAAALIAAVIAPVAIGLLLLSLIPIPFASDAIRGIVRNLAGSFGDLLVLVRSPVRFAAMTERVRGDIDWVSQRADRVMVVAHSQGSAVAWQAIRRLAQMPDDEKPSNIDLFLSFGQAFRKLKSLHRIHTRVSGIQQAWFAILAAGSTILLVIAGLQGLVVVGTFITNEGQLAAVWEQVPGAVIATAASFAAVSVIQRILRGMAELNDQEAELLILADLDDVRGAFKSFRWLDLWASADPAPNGPLFSGPVDGVASYRIRNLASTILDHSVYWSNVTEFVSAVAFTASSLTPWSPLGTNPIPERLRTASNTRESRVSMLALGRMFVVAALLSSLYGLREELPEIGNRVLAFIASLPLVPDDFFDKWAPGAKGGVAAAVIIAVASAVWWLLMGTWRGVVRTDEGAFFGSEPQAAWSGWATAWAAAASALPTGFILWLWIVTGDPRFILGFALLSVVGILIVLVLLRGSEATLGSPDMAGAAVDDGGELPA